ncbi:unnamed protein product [Rotaria sp. Silwood1]|nr:unnamed protein product [Rotaria sp. Silwood1]
MFPSEGLNDISEDPTSEIGDDAYFEDDDIEESQVELAENETDQKDVVDPSHTSQSARSPITKSLSSSAHSDGRRGRFRNPHEHLHTYGSVSVKRDPAIESIIESRQFSIIENPYTRLAQVTSQPTRLSQRSNQFELPIITESDTEMKVRSLSSRNKKKISALPTAELDKQEWDDGLIGEHEKESVPALDKSCLQIYEETCARFNVCPCSIIVRSLNTTEINLRNYGLGPRGCAALAASLIHNTTVLSLNLSANNIGNGGMAYVYQIFTENIYIEEYVYECTVGNGDDVEPCYRNSCSRYYSMDTTLVEEEENEETKPIRAIFKHNSSIKFWCELNNCNNQNVGKLVREAVSKQYDLWTMYKAYKTDGKPIIK